VQSIPAADLRDVAHDQLDVLFQHRVERDANCECTWCSRLDVVLTQLQVVFAEPRERMWERVE
jgi:hypothetical protein